MTRPLVKICGVTRPGDADLAVDLGADLIGVNFYPPSPRCLSVEAAREIADAVAGRALLAGVFVDRPLAEIEEIAARTGLDLVQLHGDEGPEVAAALGARALKAFRVAPAEGERLDPALLEPYPGAWGFLFDVCDERLYGGTGRAWSYRSLSGLAGTTAADGRPVLVAGGVGPRTARAALEASGAAGVDVCSGVESAPGIKDPLLLLRLIEEVHRMGAAETANEASETNGERDG
jgi:phosphoribosylanthranilate isomerase